ncbi:hypothetical protein SETIT_3G362800v2 [Setaria italica]|uniref:Uncharacterized protein n=1 Tax=Setaria italica TaxID=4555 RepID=A0A368QPI0_SETIT|nr:hypothetical protein SETIT_3G362800v2 [Setaria italica]
MVIGASCRPTALEQFWKWAKIIYLRVKKFFMAGLSAICWPLWKSRNSVCFDRKTIKSPTEIVCLASSFIVYWAGLQK